jgi:hypothetical protein
MLGRGKTGFLWGKVGILGGNKLRGKIGNTESYMDFHISKLVRLLYITLMLFMLNFASPFNRVLGRYLTALISCPTADH